MISICTFFRPIITTKSNISFEPDDKEKYRSYIIRSEECTGQDFLSNAWFCYPDNSKITDSITANQVRCYTGLFAMHIYICQYSNYSGSKSTIFRIFRSGFFFLVCSGLVHLARWSNFFFKKKFAVI